MTDTRGGRGSFAWQLPESHLLPDAVVAFVDGELSAGAHERAASHVARCPCCAADVAAQRQARAAVHESFTPSLPAGLLKSLHAIPVTTELPTSPDTLAVTEDGQLVAVQRPSRGAADPAPLGSSAPLGANAIGARRSGRKVGAGLVLSGFVLSAMTLIVAVDDPRVGSPRTTGEEPTSADVRQVQHQPKAPASTSIAPSTVPLIAGVDGWRR